MLLPLASLQDESWPENRSGIGQRRLKFPAVRSYINDENLGGSVSRPSSSAICLLDPSRGATLLRFLVPRAAGGAAIHLPRRPCNESSRCAPQPFPRTSPRHRAHLRCAPVHRRSAGGVPRPSLFLTGESPWTARSYRPSPPRCRSSGGSTCRA